MLKRFAFIVALFAFIAMPALSAAQATPEADEDNEFFSKIEGYVGGASSNLTPRTRSLTGVINVGSGMAQFEDEAAAEAAWTIFTETFLDSLTEQGGLDISGIVESPTAPEVGDEAVAYGGVIAVGEGMDAIKFNVSMIFARQGTVIFGVQALAGGEDPVERVEELIAMIVARDPQPFTTPVDGSSEDAAIWDWLLTPQDEIDGFVVDELTWRDADGNKNDALDA